MYLSGMEETVQVGTSQYMYVYPIVLHNDYLQCMKVYMYICIIIPLKIKGLQCQCSRQWHYKLAD